jgi:copper chaperone
MDVATYSVPAVHCAHCSAAISAEVGKIAGVEGVDLEEKLVSVRGAGVSDAEVRRAIAEAGYEIAS